MRMFIALVCIFLTGVASADIIYNGDFRLGDSNVTQADTLSDMMVFDDFQVGNSHVTAIWGNFLVYQQYALSSLGLTYEIRTGVTSGSGGTLIARGSVANLQQTYTGRSTQNGAYREVQLYGAVQLNLHPGIYWIGLQNNEGTNPPAQWTSFLAQTTGGDNGPSSDPNPLPQNGIHDSSSFATGTEIGDWVQQNADFSIGLLTVSVPESTAGILLLFLAAPIHVFLRRRPTSTLPAV